MNISLDVLKKHNACSPGIECFEYLKTRTLSETVNKCMDLSDDVVLQWTDDALNKYRWCSWLLSRILPRDEKIKYAVYAAKMVLDIFEKKYPNDNRPRRAAAAAELYLEGKISKGQLRNAAADAAYAATAATADADAAADDATAAADAAAAYAAAAAAAADAATAAATAAYADAYAAAADAAAAAAADAAAAAAAATAADAAAAYANMFRFLIIYGLNLIDGK